VSAALFTQHAVCLRRVILSSVAGPAVPYFSTLSHKRHDFRKKSYTNINCVLIFSTNLSKVFLILRMIERHIIINVHRSSCKVPLLLLDFDETSIFWADFGKILISMKILQL